LFIYFGERENEHTWGRGGAEGEGERESQADSLPDTGLNLKPEIPRYNLSQNQELDSKD